MTEKSEESKGVLEIGTEVNWRTPWNSGRGLYLGKGRLLSLKTGEELNVGSGSDENVEAASPSEGTVKPVLVINPSLIRLRTIIFGVFLGNLLTGIVVGIVVAIMRSFL